MNDIQSRTARCATRVQLGLVAILALAPLTSIARAEELTSFVQHVLETHPELNAIRFNRRAVDHELAAARGLRLPTVDVRMDYGRHRDQSVSALGIETGGDWHLHRNVSVVASQRLFDGFESRHEIARNRNRVESARWRVNDTANSIALRAVQAFLEVQRAHAVLHAARANVAAHERIVSRVTSRVNGGKGSASDATEAQSRAANAKAVVAEAEGRLADAIALFRAVGGRPPGKLDSAYLPSRSLPKSDQEAVAEATALAPSVLATQYDARAAEAALGSAYARFLPRVNLEVSADRGLGITEGGDSTSDARAMLVVRWNLFNGGIDKARVWEAKDRALEAGEIARNTQRVVERETRVSWNAMTAAAKRVPLLTRQVEAGRATRSVYQEQFDAGQRRLLDLLNIQAEVFVAEASLRTEQFIGTFNSYRVLAACGRLVPALGLDLPAEAAVPHSPSILQDWRDGWSHWNTEVRYENRRDGGAQPVEPVK